MWRLFSRPQTPADMFNGHRFLSRQKEKAREGHGGWSEGEGGRTLKDQRMKKENRKEKWQKHSIKIKRGAVGGGGELGTSERERWGFDQQHTKWRNAFLGHRGSHSEQVCTCPRTETAERSTSGFHHLCRFTSLKGLQVTIWDNYWGQGSCLTWVSEITQMWNFMAHNNCFKTTTAKRGSTLFYINISTALDTAVYKIQLKLFCIMSEISTCSPEGWCSATQHLWKWHANHMYNALCYSSICAF